MKRIWVGAVAAALLCAQAAIADVLVDNVNGYTLGANGSLIRFTGLVIGDDGTVKDLVNQRDRRSDRTTYRVDGKGRTLIPGFVDAHGRVMELGYRALQLDLSGAATLEEALAKIAAYAAANPTPRWIVGSGWDEEKWHLGRNPTAADLDAIVPDRPVWIERIDGQAGWANGLAMREAGVGPASVAPAGGRIEKSGRQPSGLFVQTAMALVRGIVPPPVPLVQDKAFGEAQERLLANGITSIHDMGTSTQDWLVMRRAGDRGGLSLRVVAYADGVDTALAIGGTNPTPWLYDHRLRLQGIRLAADGGLGTRGAWLKADYRDAPGNKGLPAYGDAMIRNLMSRGAMDRFQLAVSATGDAATAQLLGAIDELAATYTGDRRWRIERVRIVDATDMPALGRHGTIASMQPAQALSEWQGVAPRLGPDRLAGVEAAASMLANKVPLAFGSGLPAGDPNPFHGLAAAMTRQDAESQPPEGWIAEQRLTLLQAFAGYTTGAAYAAFEETKVGSLERGRMADFLLIDRDIFAEPESAAKMRGARVLETYVGGRKVWERKEPGAAP
jgi:predicted amidohydrolase YtcJ